MSNYERDVRSSLYAIVLSDAEASPLAPESDEEEIKEDLRSEKEEGEDKEGEIGESGERGEEVGMGKEEGEEG